MTMPIPEVGTLSPREREVLALVAMGKPDREIADALSISPSGVRSHLSAIFKKLRIRNRTQAATWWLQHGAEAAAH